MAKSKKTTDSLASPYKEKPSIRLDETDFPGLKNLKIDQEVTLEVKATVRSLGKEDWGDDKRLWGSFRVVSVKSDDADPGIKGFDSVKIEKRTKGS